MALGKGMTYTVTFKADTSQLKASMNQAMESLTKLGTSNMGGLTTELKSASQGAIQLAANLSSAFNTSTGKLDLLSFNQSLKTSSVEVKDFANQLSAFGIDGQKAFLNVANSVSQAELPLKTTNKLMDSLWTSMKNTMRWYLSTSIVQGFASALQSAYNYAEDLNESLNNIRIVTQKSTDDMADFAKQANKAAQALSTTTTDYTDASLIYYQQGDFFVAA